jgi:hypothetical protein
MSLECPVGTRNFPTTLVILSLQLFWTFVMSCHLLSKLWTFCQGFFQHVCHVQPAFQRNVDVLSHDFWTSVMSCCLLSEMWMFCHRIYEILMMLSEGKNSKKSHETVPLNDTWTTSCLGRAVLLTSSSYMAL